MEPDRVELVAQHADIVQIGARNVQNFSLLRRVAEAGKPVLLKRGMATSVQEWLLSAEYVLAGGNPHVILCERGIRTFETSTRFTLDLNAIPVLRRLTHLPVLVDPSHGTGHWEYVEAMALAGVAAGADGLLIEVHPRPEEALSDGPQSLKPERFARLMDRVRRVAEAVGRPDAEIVHDRPRPGDVARLIADVSRARTLLGYEPRVSLSEGLQRLLRDEEETQ